MSSRENIADLDTYYPLLPSGGVLDDPALRKIVDLRVCFVLDSGIIQDMLADDRLRLFTVSLKEVSGGYAKLELRLLSGRPLSSRVPVSLLSAESCTVSDLGYMQVSEPLVFAGSVPVNPVCVRLMAEPSQLVLIDRSSVLGVDASKNGLGEISDGYRGPESVCGSEVPGFASGNNLEVSFNGEYLVFNGVPGAGSGVYDEPPFIDFDKNDLTPARGLRDINGISGHVSLSGSSGVAVKMSSADVLEIESVQGA